MFIRYTITEIKELMRETWTEGKRLRFFSEGKKQKIRKGKGKEKRERWREEGREEKRNEGRK